MRDYFLRRLLLIPPTLFGVTLVVFALTRAAPGGPLERALQEAQMVGESGGSFASGQQGTALSDEQIQTLKEYYGFDKPWYVAYVIWLGNLAQGDLGDSFRYSEPVWSVMKERLPISGFYGLTTLILTYVVCIPLGLLKALKHRTFTDNATSVLIFIGYAIPGYALGAILLLFFAARLEWFPMGGFTSYNYDQLGTFERALDIASHAALPLTCYMVGAFAVTTMLMKNHLMENLAADYMRTAIAKGVSLKNAVKGHALRNSLIPIATTFGQNITFLISGSFLIEFIFDIDGFGLLGLNSLLDRDYPVVMGVVFLASLLLMIGNILSDILVALVDPRIRFE